VRIGDRREAPGPQIQMSVEQIQKDVPEQIDNAMKTTGKGDGIPCDLHGRPFSCAVDKEHKATELKICSFALPHMRTFHASWMGFFSTFFSTFAPAPLAAYLKREDTLGLSAMDIGNGNIASVAVTIIFRVIVGVVCDILGARRGLAFLLLLACPGIVGMMFVQSGAAFIAMRAVIGCGLATFVCCQVWCSQQFSKNVVGAANATAALGQPWGWCDECPHPGRVQHVHGVHEQEYRLGVAPHLPLAVGHAFGHGVCRPLGSGLAGRAVR
jgi:NNP family nitrate/nitrite transporter-like MFS transporter